MRLTGRRSSGTPPPALAAWWLQGLLLLVLPLASVAVSPAVDAQETGLVEQEPVGPVQAEPTGPAGTGADEEEDSVRRLGPALTPEDGRREEGAATSADDGQGLGETGAALEGEAEGVEPTFVNYGVSRARPWHGIQLGNLHTTLFLGSTLDIDDNIFLRDDDESRQDPTSGDDSDVVFINVPGLRLDYALGDHTLSAEYRMEISSYAESEEQNQINNFYDAQASLSFNEVYFNIGSRLQTLSDPIDLALSNKVERMVRSTSVLAGLKHLRLTLELNYRHDFYDFENQTFQHVDHQEDYVSVVGSYQLTPRWAASFDYAYGQRDFEENIVADTHVNMLRFGLFGYLTRRLELSGMVGFELVTPESGSLTQDENDGSLVTTSVQAKYTFSPRTTLSASYQRATQYSAFAAYEIVNDVELTASHMLLPDVRTGATIWLRDQDPSLGPRRYQWGLRFGVDWQVRPWWSVAAEGLFRWQEADGTWDTVVLAPGDVVLLPGLEQSLEFSNAHFLLSSLISF